MTHLAFAAYVALGSNIDSPHEQVLTAFRELDALANTRVVARSALYRTAPVGYLDQPDFVNAVAKIATSLNPFDLLNALLEIERAHGRSREFKNAPRTLDLDLLLYEDLVLEEPGLTLPHPRLHERAFVLVPLNDIAPTLKIPGRGSVAQLLAALPDTGLEKIL
jgi:2-amino-4-hydroxy-6-hydroxymethyldihydropteridine diphosphokinase